MRLGLEWWFSRVEFFVLMAGLSPQVLATIQAEWLKVTNLAEDLIRSKSELDIRCEAKINLHA